MDKCPECGWPARIHDVNCPVFLRAYTEAYEGLGYSEPDPATNETLALDLLFTSEDRAELAAMTKACQI